MDKDLAVALNEQVVNEFNSAYLYLQMSAWFEEKSLKGFANWMRMQAQEETCHALIIINYMHSRDQIVQLGSLDKPVQDFKSPRNVFEETLKHEKTVTAAINKILDLATSAKDHATKTRFDWFITEQVEEEATVKEIIDRLKLLGDSCAGDGLLQMDRELGARQFVLPVPLPNGAAI